ncbi:MAG: agmatinase [Salibacteraceae bacterium]
MKHYAGIAEELCTYENAKVLLQSIPYDGTSTWGKGADGGFEAFLDASENMELFDIETGTEVYHKGVHILQELTEDSSPEAMFNEVYAKTKELLQSDKFLTFFGGEHSISIPIIKAYYEHFENLTILQIDAHADLRPSFHGTPYNHACAVYDASKNTNLIQVGIRSMDIDEDEHMDRSKVYFAEDMYGKTEWMNQSINQMTEDVYITIDLDAFDPSIMPATGTPEPGGIDWNSMIRYLRKVFEQKNVVGFDIVELAPIEGMKAPQFLVAKLYYKMLTYKLLTR